MLITLDQLHVALYEKSLLNGQIYSARKTVQLMSTGKPYHLQAFKSIESKQNLLREAINYGDCDVTLEIVLYFESRLNFSLFIELIHKFEPAYNLYIGFHKKQRNWKKLRTTFQLLGRKKDEALLMWDFAHSLKNPESRRQVLIDCLKFMENAGNQQYDFLWLIAQIKDEIELIERQIDMSEYEFQILRQKGNAVTNRRNFLGTNLMQTFKHSYAFHSSVKSSFHWQTLGKVFQLPDRKIEFACASVKAELKDWNGLKQLLDEKKVSK